MTIDIDGAFKVGQLQTFFTTDEDCFHLVGDVASLENKGNVEVFGDLSSSLVYATGAVSATVINGRLGDMLLHVTGTDGETAVGLDMRAGSNVVTNDGHISVQSDHGGAIGVAGANLVYSGGGSLWVTGIGEVCGILFEGAGGYAGAGMLHVTGEGAETVGVKLAGSGLSFVNDAPIQIFGHAAAAAGVVWSGAAPTEFRNEGSIYIEGDHGGHADAIRLDDPSDPSAVLTIVNNGVLQAASSLRDASAIGSIDHVLNTWIMTGTVDLGLQDDVFTNTGKLFKTVSLGDGADLFDGSGGTQKGLVDGGLGADTLVSALDGHAAEAAMSYDAGTDRTTLVLDVDGDGEADAAILIVGDHTGYTDFVL